MLEWTGRKGNTTCTQTFPKLWMMNAEGGGGNRARRGRKKKKKKKEVLLSYKDIIWILMGVGMRKVREGQQSPEEGK